MDTHLREIIQLSLSSTPEKMLERALRACIDISGATGGSILGHEGPHLQFLFADKQELMGKRVPLDSIAGVTVRKGVIIYTYAPMDKRHFDGIDEQIEKKTRYLLSIPIPSIHQSVKESQSRSSAGALQLLFDRNAFAGIQVDDSPQEFDINVFKEDPLHGGFMKDIFLVLPIIAFGIEVITLRQMSYQAIHELKNKLIAALSWLDFLRDDVRDRSPGLLDDPTILGDIGLVDTAIREGADLARTYLTFTKLYEPHFEITNLNAVLGEVARSLEALAHERGASSFTVATSLSPDLPDRMLDAGKLKMAFFNLGKNAVEALVDCRTKEPVVNISSASPGNTITVTISDNGPGMPREIADNLFVPFKTKKEGGTGLGLTIAKKIIDIHGGEIRCDTGVSGTAFTITL